MDGLIEPSRYVQTIHELQKTVRLDKMLAVKRVDAKEGEIFEKLVKERIEGKTKSVLLLDNKHANLIQNTEISIIMCYINYLLY